jgi:hypothetical protein
VTFDRYTDEQWATIVAARRDWPPGVDWAEVRSELEKEGRRFHSTRERRPQHPQRELRILRQKVRHINALEAEPDLPERIAADLKLWRQQLEDEEPLLDLYCSRAFRGRAHLSRDVLFARVSLVWTEQLGGELKSSRDARGNVTGPCVRFLTAALGPILGPEMPKPEGVAKIIKREGAGHHRYVDDLVDWRLRWDKGD